MGEGEYIEEGVLEGAEGVFLVVGVDSAIGAIGFFLIVEGLQASVKVGVDDINNCILVLELSLNYQINKINQDGKVKETQTGNGLPNVFRRTIDQPVGQKHAADEDGKDDSKDEGSDVIDEILLGGGNRVLEGLAGGVEEEKEDGGKEEDGS